MRRRPALPGERAVVLIRNVGSDKEERRPVPAVIQPGLGFFHLDASVEVGDVVDVGDGRSGARLLRITGVKVYEFGHRGDHIEVSLVPYDDVRRAPEAPRAANAVSQAASGHTVVQAGRDIVVQNPSVHIYPPDPSAVAVSGLSPAPTDPAQHAYQQRAMLVSATGGDEHAVRIIARMPGGAVRFDTETFRAVPQAAYEYLNLYDRGLQPAARSSQHFEFEAARTRDGRHIVIAAERSGVIEVDIFYRWPVDRGVPWDWLTAEAYTAYLFLNEPRVRSLYTGAGAITVFPKLANLRGGRVSIQGVKSPLRAASYGRPTNLVMVPLEWKEWPLRAEEDPWLAARDFLHVALADSGAFGFEGEVDRLDGPYFAAMYFDLIAPSVRFWRPGQDPPAAV